MVFLQLKVVFWKNLIIRKRHWLLTIIESVLPILLFLLIGYATDVIRGISGRHEKTDIVYTEPDNLLYKWNSWMTPKLHFSPNTEFYSDLMQRVQVKFQMHNDSIKGFPSSESLQQNYESNHSDPTLCIIFNENNKNLDYTIRTDDRYYSSQLYSIVIDFYPSVGLPYFYRQLMKIQKALDISFIEKISGKDMDHADVNVMIQQFPYPLNDGDGYFMIYSILLPTITLFSFISLCAGVLKRVVEEKYLGTRELLKMVGMKSWMLWLGWFIHGIIPVLLCLLCIVPMIKLPIFENKHPFIQYSDGSVLFVFLLLYCMAAIVSCFAFGSLFRRPTLATMCGILVWILSYVVPKYGLGLYNLGSKYSWIVNIFLNLIPNMTLHYGFLAISFYEQRELGVQWNNFYKSGSGSNEDVTLLNVFVMLILDMVIYMSFTLYMDGVNPGKYGVRKSFLFPIYALINLIRKPVNVDSQGTEPLYLDHVEEGKGLPKGIEIQDLVKRYGHTVAVNNLTLNIYRNQITVLLGHNGAGKTTTMSIITGMTDVTSGTIHINGKDIKTSMDEIRKSLGLCPQHNLLFSDLTVGEHLVFFAKLKGKSADEANIEMLELLKKLHLSEKKNSLASTLSGGMKRKLCLGMAIIGGSKVLILDEPTSGMDPESRRELWDLLLAWRGEKTILITTHFMEEADALGDWIAIMANGRLQCHGTPMYLKKEYYTGYHLSLIINDEVTPEERSNIKDIVIKYIELAELKESSGNNMIFLLPLEENSKIAALLSFLEDNKEHLKIENISVTVTTLEDVFLKVKINSAVDTYDVSGLELEDTSSVTSPMRLLIMRILALIIKKLQFFRRKIWIYLTVVIIALLLFILTIYFSSDIGSGGHNSEKLPMQLSIYGRTTAYYNGTAQYELGSRIKKVYKTLVEDNKGQALEIKNVQQAIINESKENIIYYKQHLVVGAELLVTKTMTELKALYNSVAFHSAPISLNLVTNSLAKAYLGDEYSIQASIWPFPVVRSETFQEYSSLIIILLWSILIPIASVLVVGSFIIYPHIEKITKFTQLQYMCGVKPVCYWLINYLVDFLLYLIISLMMVMVAFLMTSFIGATEFFVLLSIFAAYGAANIPLAYLFSRKKTASGGFAAFVVLSLLFGYILTIVHMVLGAIQNKEKTAHNLKIWSMLFLPQMGLVSSIEKFCEITTNKHQDAGSICTDPKNDCKNFRQLQENIIVMLCSAVFYIVMNILLDNFLINKCVSKIIYQISKVWYRNTGNFEAGVGIYQRLDESDNEKNSLIAKNLCKVYSGKSVVKGISFTLNERECVGILGVNGAGKTTTFRMLTRDEIADSGNIEITRTGDKSIPISQDKYLENLGYCPQIDGLNFVLTGRQILTLIAKLRGIEDIQIVSKFLKLFELDKYADIPCGHYSGGNKRKLSLAVALIGYPKFVLLDEPTNGVDPSSRRKFWNLIRSFKDNKDLSFILTSHSMAECEALCNNLKIMKDGRFEREGTLSELKKQHGGFNIKLKLVNKGGQYSSPTEEVFRYRKGCSEDEPDDINVVVKTNDTFEGIDALKAYFKHKYKGTIKDEHSGLLHFYIDDKSKKWSTLFKEVNEIKVKNQHLIEDYSISEASLEDIFLTVARSTGTEDCEKPKKSGLIRLRKKTYV